MRRITLFFDSLKGVFLPKTPKVDMFLQDVTDSLRNLEYYGMEHDKKNMKNDTRALRGDLNKAIKEAKLEFGTTQMVTHLIIPLSELRIKSTM